MTTLAPSFLIGSFLFLQVTRTTMGSNSAVSYEGLMSQLPLSVWKNPHRLKLIMGETLLPL